MERWGGCEPLPPRQHWPWDCAGQGLAPGQPRNNLGPERRVCGTWPLIPSSQNHQGPSLQAPSRPLAGPGSVRSSSSALAASPLPAATPRLCRSTWCSGAATAVVAATCWDLPVPPSWLVQVQAPISFTTYMLRGTGWGRQVLWASVSSHIKRISNSSHAGLPSGSSYIEAGFLVTGKALWKPCCRCC